MKNTLSNTNILATDKLQREELKYRKIILNFEKRKVHKNNNAYKVASEELLNLRYQLTRLNIPLLAPVKEILKGKDIKFYKKADSLYALTDKKENINLLEKHGFKKDIASGMWVIHNVF